MSNINYFYKHFYFAYTFVQLDVIFSKSQFLYHCEIKYDILKSNHQPSISLE